MTNDASCIMVVGAHAADAEIMGGATVLKHVAAAWRAVLVHMTPGEKGHGSLSPDEYARIKVEEAHHAARILGADCVMLPYRDGELPVDVEVQWAIADTIREYRPTLLLTHWQGSLHRDHRNTSLNVMESLFLARLPAFQRRHPAHGPSKVLYAENWEDEDGFKPDLYLDVTDVFDRYVEAIHAYSLFRGEVVTFAYEQWYRGACEMRGAEGGFKRAVALMEPRSYWQRRSVADLLL
ncbi:MAG: PIG-L family deacetylase [Chloroflexi bacterium]|nr:MAG: PIG-L family deacetylase [Chloroflexota bacterium]